MNEQILQVLTVTVAAANASVAAIGQTMHDAEFTHCIDALEYSACPSCRRSVTRTDSGVVLCWHMLRILERRFGHGLPRWPVRVELYPHPVELPEHTRAPLRDRFDAQIGIN